MHKNIKKFGFTGVIKDDSDIPRMKSEFESLVITDMRDGGYIPVLDLGPFWSTKYNMENDTYEFIITLYGLYVGKRKAWEIVGVDAHGKMYPMSTPKDRSIQS